MRIYKGKTISLDRQDQSQIKRKYRPTLIQRAEI